MGCVICTHAHTLTNSHMEKRRKVSIRLSQKLIARGRTFCWLHFQLCDIFKIPFSTWPAGWGFLEIEKKESVHFSLPKIIKAGFS